MDGWPQRKEKSLARYKKENEALLEHVAVWARNMGVGASKVTLASEASEVRPVGEEEEAQRVPGGRGK